jgi:4'-phosphopantetheinyl transferase
MELLAARILDNLNEERFEVLMRQLDGEKRELIRSMKDSHSARTALTSALLIRHAIRSRTGLSNENLVFNTNQHQKPQLAGVPDLHFNLSHSGDWVVGAIDSTPIGIDLEKIEYCEEKLPLDFLSVRELAQYHVFNFKERITFFYAIWTGKESYAKALGLGLNISFDNITVLPQGDNVIVPVVGSAPDGRFFIKPYFLDPDYAIAVCAMHRDFPEKMALVDSDDLMGLGMESVASGFRLRP